MVGEVTFSWFSFLPCGPPSVTFGDTALKLEFCTFKLCFLVCLREIKLPWPGCFAIWDCEIFGLRLPIALSCHARIWNLIFVFFAGAWFNHFLTLIRSLMLCWTLHDYWFVCRLQTWMNMFLCGSSMRKSQIKDLWQKPCYTQIGICNSNHANKGPRNRIKVHSLMYRYLLLISKSKNQIFFELSKSNFTSLALLIFVNLLFKSE